VNDQGRVLAEPAEQIFDRLPVADVEVVVLIIRHGFDEPLPVGQGGRLLAEKPLPEIVVNARHFEVFAGEALDALRANQAGGAGYNYGVHKIARRAAIPGKIICPIRPFRAG
jgi:hypothetical protein